MRNLTASRAGNALARYLLLASALSVPASSSLAASELKVREAASAYPQTCHVEGGPIGVDYLSSSLPTPQGTQMIPGIVIVEVGVYPSPERSLQLTEGSFSLDWKGAEWPLGPAGPDFVLAQLLHPEWAYPEQGEGIDLQVGTVNRQGGDFDGIASGRTPRRYPRFPGEPRADQAPREPETPLDERPERIIPLHALGRDEIDEPAAGYVYFPYRGRLKKLRKLTLNIQLPDEGCEFLLRK